MTRTGHAKSDTARLTLLCHAPTAATRAAAFPNDERLDAKGKAAAGALAGQLKAARLVLSSPARSAMETAAVLGLTPREESALRDIDFGDWKGRTLNDLAQIDPDAIALWLSDANAAPHGGESTADLLRRVGLWMDSGTIKGRILAITHAAVFRAAVLHALDAPPQSFWRIDAAPLSTIELKRNGDRWALQATRSCSP